MSFLNHLRSVARWIIGNIFKMSLFATHGNVVRERQITRVYLIVLATAVLILIIRTGLANQPTLTETIQAPSLTTFRSLLSKHPDLSCPCSQLSVSYASFISIDVSYHQICSSSFISSTWLNRTIGYAGFDNVTLLFPYITDFRRQAVVHFELIGLFCQLVSDAINDAISVYKLNQLVTTQPLENATFYKQVESLVNQFQISVPNDFVRHLTLVRQTTQGNAWLTLYTSNWRYVVRESFALSTIFTSPIVYGNCSCATNPTCSQPAGVYENQMFVELPGFRIGCYPLEALLQSSLICLFNSTCVKLLEFYFPSSIGSGSMKTLIEAELTRYKMNITIETLVNQLLVEQWITNISYDAYFIQCAPSVCTFTYTRNNGPLVMITTILGLFGGLTITLRMLVPLAFYLVWHTYDKFHRADHSVSPAN